MIIWTYSGLMSRCRCLADAYYLAKKYEKKPRLLILWPLEEVCSVGYKRIFSERMFEDIELKVITYDVRMRGIRSMLKSGKIIEAIYEIYNRVKNKYLYWRYRKNSFIYEHIINETPEVYREKNVDNYKTLIKLLNDSESETSVVNYEALIHPREYKDACQRAAAIIFQDKYINVARKIIDDKDQVVGVHIRGTDHEVAKKNSPVDMFIDIMRHELENNPNVRFYLSTDEIGIQNTIVSLFGDKIITYEKNFIRETEDGLLDGIIDMLCLSFCSKIYGSYSSQFSGFAAEYGNIEKITVKKEGDVIWW